MDQFKQKAIEEAFELISDLEESLLVLESNSSDKDIINKVFRIMHTIKGNSAMFGFDFIAEFTHHLENIYDLARNEKLKLSNTIFNLTLESVDHLKVLLVDFDLLDETNKSNHLTFLSRIKDLAKNINQQLESGVDIVDLDKESLAEPQNNEEVKIVENEKSDANKEEVKNVKAKPGKGKSKKNKSKENKKPEEKELENNIDVPATNNNATYLITFIPNKNLLKTGSNPIYILEDLQVLGKNLTFVDVKDVITLDDFVATDCYLSWKVILTGALNENDIKDVFIFVETDCIVEIKKISDEDLLIKPDSIDTIKKLCDISKTASIVDIACSENVISKSPIVNKKEVSVKSSPVKILSEIKEKSIEISEGLDKDNNSSINKKNNSKENAITSIRVSSEKLDTQMNLVSELVTTQARLSMLADNSDNAELTMIAENVQKLTRQLRDITFSICLVPIQNILTRFQRLVRDLSAELKKDIELVIEGAETEHDKSIIECLADPLMHIIRNSIDHGIEDAETRVKLGKSKQGRILIKAFYSGANVIIQIVDDGKGIDVDKVKESAIKKGLISADLNLSKKEVTELLFLPGFSTAEKITNVSGRGVGMDVVRRKIMEIRGQVDIDSKVNLGTTITIKLPLTLSIIDGLLVEIDEVHYIIPLSVIDKCYAIEHEKIQNAYNNIIILDGVQFPFYYLREEFNTAKSAPELEQIVVVRYDESRVGMVIDRVVGEYQAVLKPLGKMYKEQDMISGASILGDGTIALVLDTNKIIKRFSKQELV